MHELSVAMNIIEIVEQNAKKVNAERVNEIEMEIGTLSGVIPEILEFSLDIAANNTILENATRKITIIQAKARCIACSNEFPINDIFSTCPACNSFKFEIIQGKELRVKSINVD